MLNLTHFAIVKNIESKWYKNKVWNKIIQLFFISVNRKDLLASALVALTREKPGLDPPSCNTPQNEIELNWNKW